MEAGTEEKSVGRLAQNKTDELSDSYFKPEDIFHIEDRDERFAYKALSIRKLEENGWNTGIWELMTSANQSKEKMSTGFYHTDAHAKLNGLRRVGGMVWARCPKEKADARNAFYRNKARQREELERTRSALSGVQSDIKMNYRKGDKRINIDI